MIKLYNFLVRLALPLLAVTAALALCGCITASGPLINPASGIVDARLLGTWMSKDKNGSTTITFRTTKVKGEMTGDEIDAYADKTKSPDKQHYLFVVSTLNGHSYMSAMNPDLKAADQSCTIARYTIHGSELEVRLGDEDVEKALMKTGTIQGKKDVAQASSLAQYLRTNSAEDLFPAKDAAKLTRQTEVAIKPVPVYVPGQ